MTTLPSNQPTWALGEGPARLLGDDGPARLRIELMGTLELRDGWLACVDPYTLASQVELEVPAGEHEVYVTVADVSEEQDGSHCRNSALSLLLAPLEESGPRRRAWTPCSTRTGTYRPSGWMPGWPR